MLLKGQATERGLDPSGWSWNAKFADVDNGDKDVLKVSFLTVARLRHCTIRSNF